MQGWEFAHRFSERIARFLQKNERMSKKTSDSLIFGEQPEQLAHGRSFLVSNLSDWLMPHGRSFLVSDLSESFMVAHFW